METRKNKRIKKYMIMLTLATCLSILITSANVQVKAVENYTRVNPKVEIEQLERELGKTGVIVYNNVQKEEVITTGNVKTGMYITSNENPEGNEIAVRGDVNADGRTDQIDLSYLIRYIIGLDGYTLENVFYEAGDFRKDGNVDQIDLTHIIRYIVYGTIDKEDNENSGGDKDTTPPEILEIKYSEQDWTNQDVKITTTWEDKESGIEAYQIQLVPEPNESGWYILEREKKSVTLNTTITKNDTYYIFVKNVDGTVAMKEIKVENIDKTAPQVTLEQVPNSGKINVNMVEEGSGIVVRKYAQGEQDISYFETQGIDFEGTQFEVTEDGTYTVYVQDRAGNKTIETISVIVEKVPGISETQTPPDGTSISKGETSEIVITPNMDITIDKDKFVPIDENGNPMDVILDITVDEEGKIHIGITGGNDEGEVHIKVLPGALTDSEGKTNEEFIIDTNIVIDNTKPGTEITNKPEDGSSIKEGDNISITIQTGEKVTIDNEKIQVTGDGSSGAKVEVVDNGDGTVTVIVTGGNGEGNMQIEIQEGAFTDAAGNTNDSTVIGNYIVDNTSPTITQFEVVPPVTSNTITVKVIAQDNNPAGLPEEGAYEYHISTNPDFTDESVYTENVGEKIFSGLEQNTTYYVKVVVKDEAGNIAESQVITASTISVPEGETEITFSDIVWQEEKASITIHKGENADGYTVKYQIKDAQGNVVQDWTALEGNSQVIGNLLPGYTIIARLEDESGNAGKVVTASIIETTPPQVTLQEQENMTQGNVTVTVTIVENESGIAEQKYAQGNQDESYFLTGGTIIGETSSRPEEPGVTQSTFEATENGVWTVYVKDKAGNVTVETITITKKDNEKPTIENTQLPPTSETIREGGSVEIVITPSEPDVTINQDKFIPTDKDGNPIDATVEVSKDEEGKIHVVITAGKDEGEVSLEIQPGAITDQAGNTNDKITIDTNTTINNAKPSVNIQTGADKPVITEGETTTVVIKPNTDGTVDLDKIGIGGDGSNGATIEKELNPDGSITITITGGNGTGDVYIELQPGAVTDNAGNTSDAIQLPVTKTDNTSPNVTIAVTNVTTNAITVKANAVDIGDAGLANPTHYSFTCSTREDFGTGGADDTQVKNTTDSTVTFSGLANNSTYYIKVEVKDTKGNLGVSNVVAQKTGDIPASDTNIVFGEVIWKNGKAEVTVSKNETVPSEISLEYQILQGDAIIQDWQIAPQSQITIPGLESGTMIIARLVDSEGNSNGTKSLAILDDMPPTIGLQEQAEVTSGNVTVIAIVTDTKSGVAVKKYAQGNQPVEYFATAGTEFFGTSFEATENGVWTVYAKDVAGNESIKTITITKQDKTKPGISKVEVPQNTVTIPQGGKVTVVITPSEEVTIDQSKFVPVDESGNPIDANVKVTKDADGTITVEITAGMQEGEIHLKVEAGALTDAIGNKNEESIIQTNTQIDNTKPILTPQLPAEIPVITEGGTTTLEILVGENGFLHTEKISVTGSGSENAGIMVNQENGKIVITVIGGTGTGNIDVVLGEGAITDQAGNASAAQTIPNVANVDNKGPIISSIDLLNKTTSTIKIQVNAEDEGTAGLATEGTYTYVLSTDASFPADNTYEFTHNGNISEFTGLQANTTYYIEVIVKDALGNETVSEVQTITTASLPVGSDSITFSEVTWNNHVGNVTITKNEEAANYMIQYKVVNKEGMNVPDWTTVDGSSYLVENVENGSTVYARLYDGTSGGSELTKKVEDTKAPTISKVTITTDETGVGISMLLEATDENGLSETEPYTVYYKKSGDANFQKLVSQEQPVSMNSILETGTEYTIYAEVRDYFGNVAKTSESTFTTTDAVARIEDKYYSSLQRAFDAVNEGQVKTIYLLKSISEVVSFTENRVATLDLSGKTLTGQIQVKGYLNIQNGNIAYAEYAPLHVHETGTMVLKQGLTVRAEGDSQVVANFGTLTLEGASVQGNKTAIYNMAGGTVTMHSGTVTASMAGYATIRNEGILNINGGSVTSQDAGNVVSNSSEFNFAGGTLYANGGIALNNTGTLKMTGGTIDATIDGSQAISNTNMVTITNGTISGSNTVPTITNQKELTIDGEQVSVTGGTNLLITQENGTTYLRNGTFHGTGVAENTVAIYNMGNTEISGGTYTMDTNLLIGNKKTLTISAGNFNGKIGSDTTMVYNFVGATTDISGGVFRTNGSGQIVQNYGTATISGNTDMEGSYTLVYNYTPTSRIDITGGKINATGNYNAVHNLGTLNVSNATITSVATAISGNGILNITSGTIRSTNGNAIYTEEGGNTTISGAMIEGASAQNPAIVNYGTTVINNANAQITALDAHVVQNITPGNITISAGTLKSLKGDALYNTGTLTVKGTAKITAETGASLLNAGTWYMQGGTLTSKSTTVYAVQNTKGSIANMTGGTVTTTSLPIGNEGEFNFSAGLIETTAVGQAVSNLAGGNFAMTGGTLSAVATANPLIGNSGTLNIRTNITHAGPILVTDAGGVSNLISGVLNSTVQNYNAFAVQNATMNVQGATITSNTSRATITIEEGGILNASSGVIENTLDSNAIANAGTLTTSGSIKIRANSVVIYNFAGSKAQINGGTITGSGDGNPTILNNAGNVTITAGSVTHTLPIENYAVYSINGGTYTYKGGTVGQVGNA